jgi:hypothetical protein
MIMANHDKAASHSSREPRLRQGMPASLRNVENVRFSFDQARDPFIAAQLQGLGQTEAQRRDEGEGSDMVKLHKPFPELRHKHDLSQIRKSFNQQYLSEHRHAGIKALEAQEQYLAKKKEPHHEMTPLKYGHER